MLYHTKSVSGRHKIIFLHYFTCINPCFLRQILSQCLHTTQKHHTYIDNQSDMLTCTKLILYHTKSVSGRHKIIFSHYLTCISPCFWRQLLSQCLHTTPIHQTYVDNQPNMLTCNKTHALSYKKCVRTSQNHIFALFYMH